MAMTKRKKRPYDPAAATKAALERIDTEKEIARLEAMGAVVKLDHRRKVVSAFRSNVFNLLRDRGTINPNQFDAAYRLSLEWAAWKGLDGQPEGGNAGFVDGGGGCQEIVSDRMISAGKRVEIVLSQIQRAERRLIEAFMFATVEQDRAMVWRAIVSKTTGEQVRDRQTALVVSALEALRQVYQDEKPQHRVRAKKLHHNLLTAAVG